MTTVSEFIDALGGTTKAAALFGRTKGAVSNWRQQGLMPWTAYARARDAAIANGIPFHDGLFGVASSRSPRTGEAA